jgi:hypothetical protein
VLRNANDLRIPPHHYASIKRLPLFSFPKILSEKSARKYVPLLNSYSNQLKLKVWWHYATLFEINYFLTFIHTIQSHSVHPTPFAEARLLEDGHQLKLALLAAIVL